MAWSTNQRPSVEDLSSGASADGETVVVGHGTDASPSLETPRQLGRYIVVEQIGAGGMGRVLRAYDPKLRREVALKLLTTGAGDSQGAARIVREAQAMARLSHPNLVPVYDVEQDGELAFIAMEYVQGETLKTWLADARRSWREIVAAFVAAGRGLAAAHAAGVVHRDFKPSNVMVTETNVRVMDFGLARGIMANEAPSVDDLDPDAGANDSTSADGLESAAAALSQLTQAGAIVGTPPYMAPEQHCGAGVIAASDQYAFCVALYEALLGVRPFKGVDLPSLVRAKLRGLPDTPPSAAQRVPQWLRAAVLRGLAVEPADRWPSMAALVDVLERGQSRARTRRVIASLGAIGIAVAGIALAYQLDVRKRRVACERQGASIGEVWNDQARSRLHEALVATGVSYAETTANKVTPWLDAQARAWQHARTEACLDESVRELWTADTLDRSLWCLDERRMQLEALVDELSRADPTSVQRAVMAAAGLTGVAGCRDAGLLAKLPPPPAERREEVRAVRAELSRADALGRAGRSAEGLELARSARAHAEGLGWPPLSAVASGVEAILLEVQGAYDEAERADTRAYFEAARLGAWDVAAGAATRLVFVVGSRDTRHADGLAWGEHAEVALGHTGDPGGLREARRLYNLASVHHSAGEYAQARTLHERALAMVEQALGPDHPDLASHINGLAGVHFAMGEYEQTRTLVERAVDLSEQALGPDHPDFAAALGNLGNLRYATGDYEQARALLEQAVGIFERAFGPDHPSVANNLNTLAIVYAATEDYPQALKLHERVLAMRERTLGPDHADVATTLNNLASVRRSMGENAAAQALYERALAIWETELGPEHPNVAACLNNLGDVHRSLGEHGQARSFYERALAIREKAVGPDHPGVSQSLFGLAEVSSATGDHEGAVRLLNRAVGIYDKHEGEQHGELDARFALAEALVATGGDRARARALAEQARDGWRAAARPDTKRIAEVEQWLAAQ